MTESSLSERSGLSAALVAVLQDDPAYVIPCPACSFIGVDEFPDTIKTPGIIFRARVGQYALTGCSGACSLCREILKGDTPAAVATAWRARVAHCAQDTRNPISRKVANTLQRLHSRGLLPADFPLPAGL